MGDLKLARRQAWRCWVVFIPVAAVVVTGVAVSTDELLPWYLWPVVGLILHVSICNLIAMVSITLAFALRIARRDPDIWQYIGVFGATLAFVAICFGVFTLLYPPLDSDT